MAFPPTSRTAYSPYLRPTPMSCTDCKTPHDHCSEPACATSSALTEQCTDQCVVIACDDPDHPESLCAKDSSHTHCDFSCDKAVDCCDGFDTFLSCCDEYQAYPSAMVDLQQPRVPSQAHAPNAMCWDPAFNDLWCNDCGGKASTSNLEQQRPTNSNLGLYIQSAAHEKASHALDYSAQQDPFQIHAYGQPQNAADKPSFSCMWGSCHAAFSSLSELVGHVNLRHLTNGNGPPPDSNPDHTPSPTPDTGTETPQSKSSLGPVACLWADCNNPAFPSYTDREFLSYHLLGEHLGVLPDLCADPKEAYAPPLRPVPPLFQSHQNSSSSTPLTPTSSPPETHLVVASSSSGKSTPSLVDDSCPADSSHPCRWKGCTQVFGSCDGLTAHINSVHIGGGKAHYECFWDGCTRNGTQGFQSKQKICRHVQSHTGHRPFQCAICQQNFSEAATLQQHIRRHTQEKPYVCDYPGCGKSFAITGALTIHKRTHNGDKPFKCTFCDRAFAESSNLSKHLRTHTGARPYVCAEPGCNKAFARPDQLNRHKSVHRKRARGVSASGED